MEKLERGDDNRYFCDMCPKRKAVTGATPEGAKLAAVCHFSIQVILWNHTGIIKSNYKGRKS